MITVTPVRTARDAAHFEAMAWEFVDWLRERYPDCNDVIDDYLERQRFRETMGDVLAHYVPPDGECLLALLDGDPVGILMLKVYQPGICEMNRMYVRDVARGKGIGRALIAALIDRAAEMGFQTMILGALPRHYEALPLYRSMGFVEYPASGAEEAEGAIMMRRDLVDGPAADA